MQPRNYVIGVDYGTDSVRSLVVDAATGQEMASAVFHFPRWKQQLYCNPARNQFRQLPPDHLEGLEDGIGCVCQETNRAAAPISSYSKVIESTTS